MFAASKSGQSAAAVDPFFRYVPLLLDTTSTNGQQNNTFLDSSTNNFTITRNGTPTQGSVTPYWPNGYWSNLFNGTSDYLTTASANIAALSGQFTIEGWVYFNSVSSSTQTLCGKWGTSLFGWILQLTNTAVSFSYGNGTTFTGTLSYATTFTVGTWYHIAIVRNSSNSVSAYVNGSSIGTPQTLATSLNSAANFGIGANLDGPQQYLNAYVSNFRLVNGTAVYTGNFTPSAYPLTAITNTSLLICQSNRFRDNSTNNFAITASGTPKVQAFQPFSPAASYTAAAYGGSGYFNGSTDYLSLASNAAFGVGTGDLTIEAWVYCTSLSNPYQGIISTRVETPANYPGLGLVIDNSKLSFTILNVSGALTDSTNIPLNQWVHVAGVRSGTNAALFVNGVRKASGTNSENGTAASLVIGRYYTGSNNYYLNGNISNARLVKGTAVYDPTLTTLTVPTAPVTAITNTSLLLNCTNAGIYDAAVQNNQITVGDAQASTTQSKWSPTSMKFDGTGDWLTAIDGPQLQLGTGDFTIDGWVYLSATGAIYGIISKGAAATGWSVNVTVLNKLQFSYTASNLTGATSLAASTWYYFAVVRSGTATGNLKLYLNGAVDATSGGAVTDNFNQTDILYVGASRIGATPLNGYLQDVRITRLARTITTPTAAFPTR
tara:strand:+ start:3697 stop:5682 length:1986 start_codon:yes stop_codon:yes gene_type:complete